MGMLYNGNAVLDSRNIAPVGWHLPTVSEFDILIAGLSPTSGGKLKKNGTTHWLNPNTGATNSTGFNGVGSGFRDAGSFKGFLTASYFWCSHTLGGSSIFCPSLMFNSGEMYETTSFSDYFGLSLRFIKDSTTDTGSVTGNDNSVYATVTIGSQVWMASNSRETKFRDGSSIPEVRDQTTWNSLSTPGRCFPNNMSGNL